MTKSLYRLRPVRAYKHKVPSQMHLPKHTQDTNVLPTDQKGIDLPLTDAAFSAKTAQWESDEEPHWIGLALLRA